MLARMNGVACTKVAGEGFCLPTLASTFGGLMTNMATPEKNPFCSKAVFCPKKISLAFIDILAAHMPGDKTSMEAMKKLLEFSCLKVRRGGLDARLFFKAKRRMLTPPLPRYLSFFLPSLLDSFTAEHRR